MVFVALATNFGAAHGETAYFISLLIILIFIFFCFDNLFFLIEVHLTFEDSVGKFNLHISASEYL